MLPRVIWMIANEQKAPYAIGSSIATIYFGRLKQIPNKMTMISSEIRMVLNRSCLVCIELPADSASAPCHSTSTSGWAASTSLLTLRSSLIIFEALADSFSDMFGSKKARHVLPSSENRCVPLKREGPLLSIVSIIPLRPVLAITMPQGSYDSRSYICSPRGVSIS